MYEALIITPVKDSPDTTRSTINSVLKSKGKYLYHIYNDFSTPENSLLLKETCELNKIKLINLSEITQKPSPNYRLVLELAQKETLALNLPLIIVESDVEVSESTLQKLVEQSKQSENCGLIGCITKNKRGEVNYPYKRFKAIKNPAISTKHSLSFCCTLLSSEFLKKYDFENLETNKDWYDVSVSRKSLRLGFKNYLMTNNSVIHYPHSSRPWKLTKYSNPFKYYLLKIVKGRDKI